MEVGRIVARIEGATTDFEKSMASAERRFQTTASKMNASAAQADATVKRSLTDREKWMQENVRLNDLQQTSTQKTTAVLAKEVRAQAALQRQGMAMARAHSAALNQDMDRTHIAALKENAARSSILANSVNAVSRASAVAVPNLNKLRGAVTTFGAALIPLPPGVTRLGSALGGLALGGGIMTGVMVAMTALAFIWDKLTRHARELKEETKKAAEELSKLGETAQVALSRQMGPLSETLAELNARIAENQRKLANLAKGGQMTRQGMPAIETQLNADLLERDRLQKLLAKGSLKLNELNTVDRLEGERKVAALREGLMREAFFREKTLRDSFLSGLARIPGISTSPIGRGAGAIQSTKPNLPSFGIIRAVEALTKAGQRVEQRNAGGGGFLGGLGKQLGGMIDPKMLLTGVLSGGVSTALGAISGAVGGFIGNLFSAGKRAKEAAALMKQAILDFNRSLEGARAGLSGNTKRVQELSAIEEITKFYKEWAVGAGKSGSADRMPAFDSLQKLIAYLESIEHVFLTPELTASWNALIAYAKELGISLNSASTAANAVTSALTNVPEGFKIALARFNATTGTPIRGPDLPGYPSGGISVMGDVIVNGASARSGRELLEIVEREVAAKAARGGVTLSLGYV